MAPTTIEHFGILERGFYVLVLYRLSVVSSIFIDDRPLKRDWKKELLVRNILNSFLLMCL